MRNTFLTTSLPAPLLSTAVALALLVAIFNLAQRSPIGHLRFDLRSHTYNSTSDDVQIAAQKDSEAVPGGLSPSEWQGIMAQISESQVDLSGDTMPNGTSLRRAASTGSVAIGLASETSNDDGAIFYASNAAANDQFGWSVDIDGDRLLIGAPNATVSGFSNAGAAYLFERNTGGAEVWGQLAVLRAPFPAEDDFFGQSVAISGDTVAIGAYGRDDNDNIIAGAGAVFIFERNSGGPDAWGNLTTVLASDRGANDGLGWSVDLDGNTLVAGASNADAPLDDSGEAYVFSRNQGGRNSWGEVAILSPSPAGSEPFDRFGESVSVSGDSIVVGAPGEDGPSGTLPDSGTAYLFARNYNPAAPSLPIADNWGQVAVMRASDAAIGDNYGTSVSIDIDTLVIGAPMESSSAGAAYVHLRNLGGAENWGQTRKLQPLDTQPGDQFGKSVAISDDIIVVGAPLEDGGPADPGADAGTAYIFERNFNPTTPTAPTSDYWGERLRLPLASSEAGDQLGSSVAVSGKHIIAGAPLDDGAGNLLADSGGFYMLVNDGQKWQQRADLGVTDPVSGDEFGYSVSIDGNTAVVGAWTKDGASNDTGAAYVFQRNESSPNGWGEVTVLAASNASASDRFGVSVDISGDIIVVGADRSAGTGAVYIFQRNINGLDSWGEVAALYADDGEASDFFGSAVAVDRGTLVVGAWGEDGGPGSPTSNAGAAYIFSRNFNPITPTESIADNWGLQAVLTQTPSTDAQLGKAVDISGDHVVVGAPGKNGVQGAAYVFDRNIGGAENWGLSSILSADDPGAGDKFGSAVAVHNNTIVVGAPGEDGGPTNPVSEAGAAFIFERNVGGADSWGLLTTIRGSNPAISDEFGKTASISGDTAVVGARLKNSSDGSVVDVGAAYVFARNRDGADLWHQTNVIRASGALAGDQMGTSVAISSNTIVAGAPKVEGGAGNIDSAGAAYVFMLEDESISGLSAVNDSPTLLGSSTQVTATALSGTNVVFAWNFGDGQTGEGANAAHTFAVVGQHTVTVTASNILGTQVTTTTVTIADVPITNLNAFDDDPTTLGQSTLFTSTINTGTNVSYLWEFGDGQSGSGSSPVHQYQAVGEYTATVTATNSAGYTSTITFVSVIDVPIAGLSASNDSPTLLGQATSFTATITAGSNPSYLWDFGDGTIGSGKYTSHIYPAIGAYTATVTATNGTSVKSANTLLAIQDVRVSDLSEANNGPLQLGQTAVFTASIGAGTNVVYTWDFDDGSFGAGQIVSHTYSEVGTFLAKVTASNSANSKSVFSPIVVGDVPINGLVARNDGPTPLGAETLLWTTTSNGTNVSYQWDFGDGTTGSGQPVAHIYPSLGDFTATVTATNDAGHSVSTTRVEIKNAMVAGLDFSSDNPTPLGQVTTLTATVAAGSSVQYQWDFGDGKSGSGKVVTHVFPAVGPFSVTVTASNDVSVLTRTKTVTVVPIRVFLPVIFNKYPDQWESEPNGTYADATGPLFSGLEYYGTFPVGDIDDYFYFDVHTTHDVTIVLSNIGEGHDYNLLLYDASNNLLAYKGTIGNASEIIDPVEFPLAKNLKPGRYFIRVFNYGATSSSQPYHLKATFR